MQTSLYTNVPLYFEEKRLKVQTNLVVALVDEISSLLAEYVQQIFFMLYLLKF